MARVGRKDTARHVIETWRTMWKMPGAPTIEGNATSIHQTKSGKSDQDHGPVANYITTMIGLGLIEREKIGQAFREGPMFRFTLLKPVDEGAQVIAKHFANGGNLIKNTSVAAESAPTPKITPRQSEVVAVRVNEDEQPVEAIVGSDAPSPFEALRELRRNEPAALIEAARQYEHRQDFVIERLTEIEKLGVEIDREKVMQAIHLQRDDEFEGIVKILPYIDDLESRIKQQEGWRDDMIAARNELREARTAKLKAEDDLRKQTDANRRLAEKMAQDAVKRSQPTVLVG